LQRSGSCAARGSLRRRLNLRFRRDGKLEFAHTLNGTGATAEVLRRFGAPATLGSPQ
jgi:hypothetical protein